MQELLTQIAEEISEATALRKEGDGLLKDALNAEANAQTLDAEELRAEALKVYRQGADRLQMAIASAASARAALPPAPLPAGSPAARLVFSLVELYGAAGGLFQRLGEREHALDSYREGASLELAYKLAGTYNRLNAVKLELLNGTQTLADVTPQINALAIHIQESLQDDKSLGDGGWIYADLGDCLALLGRPGEAGRAYATFIAKAGVKLPERALDVLKQVAHALRRAGDADVARVDLAIETLTGRLSAA
jgi:tetratricopeptide (TPR) repeat protein